jgi:hypothetical protein
MADEIKITGSDGKSQTVSGSYDPKSRSVSCDGKTIYTSQHDRVEVVPPKSGCFVATEVYGGIDAPQVELLREFRDAVILRKWPFGSTLVRLYYIAGPHLARVLRAYPVFKPLVRRRLDRIAQRCRSTLAK